MSPSVKVVIGGGIGLAVGVAVSLLTDVSFAPEIGLVLGVLGVWLAG